MAITTENGLYYYKGIPYTNLQDAKNAEMADSTMKVDTAIPASSGIPTAPQMMDRPSLFDRLGQSPQPSNIRDMSVNQGRPVPNFKPQPNPSNMMKDMTPQGLMNTDVNTPTETAEPSFFDRLTSKQGIGAIGSAMLAMSQDPALQKLGMANMERMQDRKQANATVALLRKQGQGELADLIEKNPSMAKTALTQFLQQRYGTKSGIKTSAVMVDPKTGQQYVVETNPNTGEITRRNVEGAFGETPETKSARTTEEALKLADMKKSQDAAGEVYKQYSNISSQIRNLETIRRELNTGNARTGVIDQFMPAFTEATATLRSAANQLGIDIINSATFGALSATELRLALDTAIPQGLGEQELLQYVDKKLEAQKKLQQELAKQADKLASGVPYTSWVKEVVQPSLVTQQPAQPSGSNVVEVDY